MKLDPNNYYNTDGQVDITDQGWIDLRNFCKAILYKQIGTKYEIDDILTTAMLRCIDKLPDYDVKKKVPLGGYLYWSVRGTISLTAISFRKEIPVGSKTELLLKKYGN